MEGVDQVKDITEKTNENVECVHGAQAKHIWLIFLFEQIYWVNYQENYDHAADVAFKLGSESRIGFWMLQIWVLNVAYFRHGFQCCRFGF